MKSDGFRPKKSLGQNFLVDATYRQRIIAAADLCPEDDVLEIGAGDGSLTTLIAELAGRVVAVELDQRLIPTLQRRFASQPHIEVVQGDILELDISALMRRQADTGAHAPGAEAARAAPFKVVANLPYYIASATIRRLLEGSVPPSLLVLTVQREVAERMVASPPRMSLLAVSVQYHCSGQVVERIPPGAFRPSPKVDSAIVRLVRRQAPPCPTVAAEDFFKAARAGFSRPRKQLRNSLAMGMKVPPEQAEGWLRAAALDPQRRAETLTLEEWGRLSVVLRG